MVSLEDGFNNIIFGLIAMVFAGAVIVNTWGSLSSAGTLTLLILPFAPLLIGIKIITSLSEKKKETEVRDYGERYS